MVNSRLHTTYAFPTSGIHDKYSPKNKQIWLLSLQMRKFKWVLRGKWEAILVDSFAFSLFETDCIWRRIWIWNLRRKWPSFILSGNNICRHSWQYAVQERVKCYRGNTLYSPFGLTINVFVGIFTTSSRD